MSCGVLIVRGDPVESFLLMKHADRHDLPKGHVDPGETEMECALRELEEETGITSRDIEIDPTFQYRSKYTVRNKRTNFEEKEKTLVIFLGRLTADVEIRPTEHAGFAWVAWSPPHAIQTKTIDPLLAELAAHLTAPN